MLNRDGVLRTIERSRGRRPPYAGNLPKVFPYKLTARIETVLHFAEILIMRVEEHNGKEMPLWHAITGHPATSDRDLTLWLSSEAAWYLVDRDYTTEVVSTVKEEKVGGQ